MTLGARLQLDYDDFSGAYNAAGNGEHATDAFVRRARAAIRASHGAWGLRLVTDHAEEARIVLAHLTYSAPEQGLGVSLGLIKEDISLEAMIGSRHSTAISRPMLTNALSPFYSFGLRVERAFQGSGARFALGVYKAEGLGSVGRYASGALALAVTGRASWSRAPTEGRILHLGAWGSERDFADSELSARLSRGEVRNAETRLVDYAAGGSKIAADSLTAAGLEAAIVRGPLSLQGELAARRVRATDQSKDAAQRSFYATASYFPTGQSRAYNRQRGVFLTPKSADRAFEILARLSRFDAADNGQGTDVTVVTIGANYYFNAGARLMLNYLDATVEGPGAAALVGEYRDGRALVARLELTF